MKILQTTDLKKYYGTEPNITRALDGVNFSVEEGEFVAVRRSSLYAFLQQLEKRRDSRYKPWSRR